MPLVHFNKWKKNRKLGPNALMLDPENYRLDRTGSALSQAQIIEQLVKNENIRELASAIVQKGYIPVDDLVYVVENGKKLVVEGNRRLCAFKLLRKPSLAPPDFRRSFENLKKRVGDEIPSQLYCVEAPNRAEANVYVFSKHADEQFSKRWQSIRQAVFVVDQLSKGLTIDQVAEQTGLTRAKIIEAITGFDLFRLAGTMNLSERAKVLITSPTTFPYTALVERIFGTEEIRKILGVELNERGIMGVAGTREGFLDVLRKIFEDLSLGTGDDAGTRKYGTKTKSIARISEFGYRAEGKSNWKAFRPEDVSFPDAEPEPETSDSKSKKKKKKKNSIDYLLPDDLEVEVGTEKLKDLVQEAKRIDIGLHCHSAAVFLRCIFELALNAAVDARNCRSKIDTRHPKSADTRNGHSVEVLLGEAKSAEVFDLGLTHLEARGLDHLIHHKGPLSYDMFHMYVHNPHWPASPQALRAMRENLLPILKKALLAPRKNS